MVNYFLLDLEGLALEALEEPLPFEVEREVFVVFLAADLEDRDFEDFFLEEDFLVAFLRSGLTGDDSIIASAGEVSPVAFRLGATFDAAFFSSCSFFETGEESRDDPLAVVLSSGFFLGPERFLKVAAISSAPIQTLHEA
jgi:hypothetical protein